jgi:histidyl-tRNA synthetase
MKYIKQRGTEDIFGKYVKILSKIESVFLNVATLSGYSEIRTPMFEAVEVFSRSVGESSDIVKKEFYNFKDKGDREIALRPEGTASVIRAVIENKLLDKEPLPLKYCYSGPMFRYERPQSGRLRQFNQFGCEIIGAVPVYDDVDCLSLAVQLLESIQIKN